MYARTKESFIYVIETWKRNRTKSHRLYEIDIKKEWLIDLLNELNRQLSPEKGDEIPQLQIMYDGKRKKCRFRLDVCVFTLNSLFRLIEKVL